MASSAGAIRAGRAYVEAFLDTTALEKGIGKARSKLDGFARQVGNLGKTFAIAGGAMIAPLVMAVSKASDLQETMNKFDVVFGDQAEAVKAWGDEYATQVGRSKKQIADFLGGTQDLLVPIGFDPAAAEEFSKQITGLAVDLASFNNMQDEDSLRDLHAALTGSGEVMKKYGVIVSEAAVKQELLNQGIDPKGATEQQKVMARMSIIMAGTTAAQGDAIRSSNSWANQTKALYAALDDLSATVGEKLLPIITPMLTQVVNGVKSFGEWASQNEMLVKGFAGLAGGLTLVGGALLAMSGAATVASAAMGAFAQSQKLLISMSGPMAAAFAVTAIVLYAQWVYSANDAVKDLNKSLKESVELDKKLNSRNADTQSATLQQADELKGAEREDFLNAEIEKAQKNLDGMNASLKGQQKIVDELEPTWKGLWRAGRSVWEVEKQELEAANDRIKQQKQFVEDLRKAKMKQAQEAEQAAARTEEESKGIEDILSRLNEQLETFGLDAGEKAVRELENLNANETELAEARKKLAELSAKEAAEEARKAQEEEQKRAQEEADRAAESIADMLQSLADEVSDLELDPADREKEQRLRDLRRLGANDEQLKQAADLLDKKFSGDSTTQTSAVSSVNTGIDLRSADGLSKAIAAINGGAKDTRTDKIVTATEKTARATEKMARSDETRPQIIAGDA